MDRGTSYSDAQYTVSTFYKDDYDNINCQTTKAPADLTYPQRDAVSGVTPVNGRLILSTTAGTLGANFLFPDQVSADGVNAETNIPFEQVVQISLQSATMTLLFNNDDPITVACCELEATPQKDISRYYRKFGMPYQVIPTAAIRETLTTTEQALAPAAP